MMRITALPTIFICVALTVPTLIGNAQPEPSVPQESEIGVHYSWMDDMRRLGVKRVTIEVQLTWFLGPRSLRITRVMYFTGYEDPASQVVDTERIQRFKMEGLEDELRSISLQRAAHGHWFEDPPHQHPARLGPVPASIFVDLVDDEWLPVSPRMYVDRDTSMSPLVQAVAAGDRVDVKKLLSQGKLNRTDLNDALHWAAAGNDVQTIQDLLAAGADVNSRRKSGYTALMGAVNNGRIANVRTLLNAGANVNAKFAETGDTALTLRLYYKADAGDIVSLLLENGADANAANKYGRTALILATFGQSGTTIQALLRAGANVNAQDRAGNTALIAAAQDNNIQAVKLLLAANANRALANKNGDTALSIASSQNEQEIVELLSH